MGKSAILKSTVHNDHIKVIGRSMSEMRRESIHQLYDTVTGILSGKPIRFSLWIYELGKNQH